MAYNSKLSTPQIEQALGAALLQEKGQYNITQDKGANYATLSEAIAAVSDDKYKVKGIVLTYNTGTEWVSKRYNGEDAGGFADEGNWTSVSLEADDEDIEQVNGLAKFKDRKYDEANFSGKGYKILRKNIQEVSVPKFDLTITNGCTSDGNITVTVGEEPVEIPVTTAAATAESVAALIGAAVPDVTVEGAVVTFKSNPVIDYSTTGVTGEVADNTYTENRNVLTQEMINEANTVYEIRYDFDLNGSEIVIPEGCVLKFEGGELNNGILNGDRTIIKSSDYVIFNYIYIYGVWNCSFITSKWFGNYITCCNNIKNIFNLSNEYIRNDIYIDNRIYYYKPLKDQDCLFEVKSNTNIIIDGNINTLKNNYISYTIFDIIGSDVKISGNGILSAYEIPVDDIVDYSYIGGVSCIRSISTNDIYNIYVNDISLKNCLGDAIYIRNKSNNICINNIKVYDCYRNGISIVYGNNIMVSNSNFYWTKGYITVKESLDKEYVLGAYAIDYELNYDSNGGNIKLSNNNIYNYNYAIQAHYGGNKERKIKSVIIENNIYVNSNNFEDYLSKDDLGGIFSLVGVDNGEILNNSVYGGYARSMFSSYGGSSNIIINNNKGIGGNFLESLYVTNDAIISNNYLISNINNRSLVFSNDTNNDDIYITLLNNIISGGELITQNNKINIFIQNNNIDIPRINLASSKQVKIEFNNIKFSNIIYNDLIYLGTSIINGIYINNNTFYIENPSINIENKLIYILGRVKNAIISKNKYYVSGIGDDIDLRTVSIYGENVLLINNISPNNGIKKWSYTNLNEKFSIIDRDVKDIDKSTGLPKCADEIERGVLSIDNNGNVNVWNGKKWCLIDSYYRELNKIGTFSEKPLSSTGIKEGFQYFCTDKQSPESSEQGLMIYHKGNNVWVDSLGRVVDDNYPATPPATSGTTEERLLGVDPGFQYFDTTLKKPIWKTEDGWVDCTGASV